ncbi:Piso0_003216 [Millerozyma farinosa CBS 7064]|uniref:Piso0_003216 protein n=1 Tax=Pichia sorbitophila (strain ATCC MYA-4447 / BCRC 22081 / CBS 7064 / NBRC 10061 / NRRL Y-12695) TaxID=559304 RepID=G8YHI1_PICSO|nr:Piso0_003216 [Millerozyma farinosa CBS 7064]CCE80883.1 Piso0_003216 [Millerozyma farinosa CBS 7064]
MTLHKPRVCLCARSLPDVEHTYKDGVMSSKSAFRHPPQTPIRIEGPIDAVTQDRASTKAVIQLPGRAFSKLPSHRDPGSAVLVYTTKHGYSGQC